MNVAGWLLLGAATPVLWRAGKTDNPAWAATGLWLATMGGLLAGYVLFAGITSTAAVLAAAIAVTERHNRRAAARRQRDAAHPWINE